MYDNNSTRQKVLNKVKVFSSLSTAKETIRVKFTVESNKSEIHIVIAKVSTNRVTEAT